MSYCLHHDKRISCPKCKEDYIYEYKTMNNPPQSVTERYVSNLIHNGRNKEFDINYITMNKSKDADVIVGYFFRVEVYCAGGIECSNASGATIQQAVHRALEKHGVTFR